MRSCGHAIERRSPHFLPIADGSDDGSVGREADVVLPHGFVAIASGCV